MTSKQNSNEPHDEKVVSSDSPRQDVEDAVKVACQRDLVRWCGRETASLALVRKGPQSRNQTAVSEASAKLDGCFQQHIEQLSSPCIEAVATRAMTGALLQESLFGALPPSRFQRSAADNGHLRAFNDDSVEMEFHYRRHHNPANAGLSNSRTHSGHHSPGIIALWVVIVPFFCFGVFSFIQHMRVHVRKRRELRRVESKGYSPLPSRQSLT